MTHQTDSATAQRPPASLLAVGVVLALLIFVGTYFTYFFRHQTQVPGSYLPLAIGIGAFFGVMVWLNYLACSSLVPSVRLAKASGIAIAESAVFLFLLLFLVLNTIGS